MGIKEDPEACWTTPFAQMIWANNLKVLNEGSEIKLVGCAGLGFGIWILGLKL